MCEPLVLMAHGIIQLEIVVNSKLYCTVNYSWVSWPLIDMVSGSGGNLHKVIHSTVLCDIRTYYVGGCDICLILISRNLEKDEKKKEKSRFRDLRITFCSQRSFYKVSILFSFTSWAEVEWQISGSDLLVYFAGCCKPARVFPGLGKQLRFCSIKGGRGLVGWSSRKACEV